MIRPLPPEQREMVRRRWSFRFGGLGIITSTVVYVWNITPDAWHPNIPEWGRYAVMGLAAAFALLSQASHLIAQPSLQDVPAPAPKPRITVPPPSEKLPCGSPPVS